MSKNPAILSEYDATMKDKGYRYKVITKDGSFQPLYAKTLSMVIWLLREYEKSLFDIFVLGQTIRLKRPGGILVCSSREAVDVAIQRLKKLGYNYFVRFIDTRGPAVQYGIDQHLSTGHMYVSGW